MATCPGETMSTTSTRMRLACVLVGSLVAAFDASAATVVVGSDLSSAVGAASLQPARFAVSVPVAASVREAGDWTDDGRVARWSCTVRGPGATALGCRGAGRLPAAARIVVAGTRDACSDAGRAIAAR